MASVPLVTALLLLVALLASAAELSRLSAPVVLVLAGLAIGFVPGVPEVRVEPDVVFLLFLPPLLYTAAFKLAAEDVRWSSAVPRPACSPRLLRGRRLPRRVRLVPAHRAWLPEVVSSLGDAHTIPELIRRRFRIRPGRRWHAIAGLSMGGYGTSFLATQLPGYFGTAVPMSGLVSIRRPEIVAGLSAIGGVKYPALWGPSDGAYARGHDPVALARNLRFTRVILRTGNGTPRRGVVSPVPQLSGALEGVLRIGNDQFAAALRRAGVKLDYRVHDGVHDWPYWRADIAAAARNGGLFGPVAQAPSRWSYRTVARSGDAWGLRFRFTTPPAGVATFTRSGDRLTASGAGRVRIIDARGCRLEATLPFSWRLATGRC